MNIRTITYFCDPGWPVSTDRLTAVGQVVSEIRTALQGAGYTVQTTRLAAPPFPVTLNHRADKAVAYAQALEDAAFVAQIDYVTIGPARPLDAPALFEVIPDVIGATQNVFAAAIIADPVTGIHMPAIRQTADIIRRCATLSPDGFGNLRFAALANVPPGVPFLPAAYHDGGHPVLSVGVEAADLVVRACAEAQTLAEARQKFIRAVEAEAQKVSDIVKRFCGRRGLTFGGMDFAPAPFPEAARSIGAALERLSGAPVGAHGTLAAAAFLTEALDRAQFKRAGFNGLFLPVLEDSVLAGRGADGTLTLSDLLLYSSVCGTGLDTAPLPGDIGAEALAAILLDVAALALRLNKPLTARLMPIPDKQVGDPVSFDFPFFASSRVLAPRSSGLGGLLGAAGTFDLGPRSR
jgi:hypothetical protein